MKIKVELTFPGKLKDEPIICNFCKKFNVVLSILEASFSTDLGWAILVIEGSPDLVKESMQYLKDKGVEIGDTQEIT